MFESRIKLLQDSLVDHEIDGLLITSSYNIAYLTGIHAFSIEEREARLIVTKQNIYLFTDARYTQMVKDMAPFVSLVEVSTENPFSKTAIEILTKEKINQLGFEEENITYREAADFEEKLTEIDMIPVEEVVENIRIVKDNDEIKKIHQACTLSDRGFDFILKHLKPGVTELEIKILLENFIRSEGGSTSFESIVAFGKNAAIPHHLSTNEKLQTSNCVLLDFGAKIEGYCSDMTRTVYVGKPDEKFQKMYEATKGAQEVTMDYLATHMKKGFEIKKAQELANSHLSTKGFQNIPHAIGHGVGLQVHELPYVSPFADEDLVPGMIITNEPGVYIPNLYGVRIEDTVLITQEGLEILTKSPKELIIV